MGEVIAVARDEAHRFSKRAVAEIRLLTGLGVEGDAHVGVTVKHRSRVRRNPDQPNLRQVHLLDIEILEALAADGFDGIGPGDIGENVLVRGMRLLELPRGTMLRIGDAAVVELTGLRNPCFQLDNFRPGLMQAMLGRNPDGSLMRKAGVMGVVIAGGTARAGDGIVVVLPPGPHRALEKV